MLQWIDSLYPHLGRDFLKSKMRNIRSSPGVLHCHCTDFSVRIKVDDRIFIKIAGFGNFHRPKLYIQRICVFKVLSGFHPLNMHQQPISEYGFMPFVL